jgi:hypothetical protein
MRALSRTEHLPRQRSIVLGIAGGGCDGLHGSGNWLAWFVVCDCESGTVCTVSAVGGVGAGCR